MYMRRLIRVWPLILAALAADAVAQLPATKRAAVIDEPGGPEVLTIHMLTVPPESVAC